MSLESASGLERFSRLISKRGHKSGSVGGGPIEELIKGYNELAAVVELAAWKPEVIVRPVAHKANKILMAAPVDGATFEYTTDEELVRLRSSVSMDRDFRVVDQAVHMNTVSEQTRSVNVAKRVVVVWQALRDAIWPMVRLLPLGVAREPPK